MDILLVSYQCICICIKVVLLPFDLTALRRCPRALLLVLIAGMVPYMFAKRRGEPCCETFLIPAALMYCRCKIINYTTHFQSL